MKILFVSQYFYPESFKGNDICFELADKGHEVTVLTGIPNYPHGSFYNGYSLFKKRRENIKGVSVVRVPLIPRGKSNAIGLLMNYFSYPITASAYTFKWAMQKRFDMIIVQQLSPVMISVPAILYKKLHNVPLHTWVLDLWPESLMSAGGIKNRHVLNFFGKIAISEYKNSDKIWMSSNSFRKSILAKGDFNDKLIYFPNWAESHFGGDDKLDIPKLPNGFIVMFAGNMGEAQDFDHIMKTALMLKNHPEIKFVFVGDGRKKRWVDEFIETNKLNDTVFAVGRYPIECMPSFFDKANVMLVTLKDEVVFNLTAPAKLQAYMAASKPIVAMINGEAGDIINDANCGLVVNAENSIGLRDSILSLSKLTNRELNEKGRNGFNYYKENFDKNICMRHLHKIISE